MSLQIAAQHLAAQGRNGDELLVHMTRQEVAGLDALARAKFGRGLPTNPQTGLPEASLLGTLLPLIVGVGGAMMGIPPIYTAAMMGGGEAIATGSLMKGLTAGIGAYGGGELGTGFSAMADGAAADAAIGAGGTATSATTPIASGVADASGNVGAGAANAAGAAGNGLDGAAGDFGPGFASNPSSPMYANGMDSASDAAYTGAGSAAPGAAASQTPMGYGSGAAGGPDATSYAGAPPAAGYGGPSSAGSPTAGYGGAADPTSASYVSGTDATSDAAGANAQQGPGLYKTPPPQGAMARMQSGIGAIGKPGSWAAFSNAMGGDNKVMQAGLMAAAPMLTGVMQPPKMPATPASKALIRPFTYDPRTQTYTAQTPYAASDANAHSFYADGGRVRGFASGGINSPVDEVAQHAASSAGPVAGGATAGAIPHYTYDPATQHFTNTAGAAAGPIPPANFGSSTGTGGQGAGLGSADQQLQDYLDSMTNGNPAMYAAGGGIQTLRPSDARAASMGRFLKGPGDGVSDSIPATINGQQPARLATEEYVVPARVVSELGNGSSTAGAQRLDDMVKRVSQARRKTMGSRSAIAADSGAHRMLPA